MSVSFVSAQIVVGPDRRRSVMWTKSQRAELFELVFSREEAKLGSVEGKGYKLLKLDPNRMAVVRECTEMLFPPDENLKWTEIKKSIDEKCKMVRNNRCFVWAGVKHLQGLKKRKYLHANRIFMLLPPIVYFLLLWGAGTWGGIYLDYSQYPLPYLCLPSDQASM